MLDVDIEIRDNFDAFLGQAGARVTRSQTVLEGTGSGERQTMWGRMTRAMIADLDREIEKQVRAHLAPYVR